MKVLVEMKCFKHLLDEASSGKYFSLASYNYTIICKQRLMQHQSNTEQAHLAANSFQSTILHS